MDLSNKKAQNSINISGFLHNANNVLHTFKRKKTTKKNKAAVRCLKGEEEHVAGGVYL